MSALSILYVVLPLPVAFIIHKVEEMLTARKLTSLAFGMAALEELVIILAATCYLLVDGPAAIYVWTATFMAFTIHLIAHIWQAVSERKYVPGLVTAIILLVYGGFGAWQLWLSMSPAALIGCTIAGVAAMLLNGKLTNAIGSIFTRRR